MAKQSGIYKFTGRLGDDLVGYRLKYTMPQIVRTMDREALRTAVLTGTNYANTRKSCSEFGAAANTASLLLHTIPTRWKSILNPYAQAHLCKELYNLRTLTSADYGKRAPLIDGTNLLSVANIIEKQQKNDFSTLYGDNNVLQYVGGSVILTSSAVSGSVYTSGDYDGIAVYTYASRVFLGYYDTEGNWQPGYMNSVASTSFGSFFADSIPSGFVSPWAETFYELPQVEASTTATDTLFKNFAYNDNSANSIAYAKSIAGAVSILQPFRVVNNRPVEFVEQAAYVWAATSVETSDNVSGSTGSNTGGDNTGDSEDNTGD